MVKSTPVGPDIVDALRDSVDEYVEAGFDHVYFHQIGPDQHGFLDYWARELRPALDGLVGAGATDEDAMAAPTAAAGRRAAIPAVLAHYRTLLDARRAIRTLGALGIDRRDLALGGRRVPGRAHRAATPGRWARRCAPCSRSAPARSPVSCSGAVSPRRACSSPSRCSPPSPMHHGSSAWWSWWFAAGAAALGALRGAARGAQAAGSLPPAAGVEPDHDVWLAVYGNPEVLVPAIEATGPIDLFEETRPLELSA